MSAELSFREAALEAARAIPEDPGPVTLDIGVFLNFRYTVSVAPGADDPADDPSIGFSFRRLRTEFEFATFDGKLGVYLQTEGSEDNVGVQDLYAFAEPFDDWRFRMGRFRLNFARETTVSSKRQIAADRGSLTNNILPGDSVRVTGLEARYTKDENRAFFTLSEGTGTELTNFNDRRPGWGVTVRGERLLIGESFGQFRQLTAPPETPRGLLFGAAGHIQHLNDDGMNNGAGTRWALTTDLNYQHDGFSALFAAMMRGGEDLNEKMSVEPENMYGVNGLVGVYVSEQVELFGRYEWGTTSDNDHPDLNVATVGFNYYLVGQAVKFTTDFSVAFDGVGPAFDRSSDGLLRTPDGEDRYIFRTEMVVVF